MSSSTNSDPRMYRLPRGAHWPVAWLLAWACLAIGCDDGNPFSQVPVQGTIRYDDGELIPAEGMRLIFDSLAPPADERRFPRPASAFVDVATGSFTSATTYRHGDGLVRGQHKVVIDVTPLRGNRLPVAPEYTQASTTPLVIDTAKLPLEIRVPKP